MNGTDRPLLLISKHQLNSPFELDRVSYNAARDLMLQQLRTVAKTVGIHRRMDCPPRYPKD